MFGFGRSRPLAMLALAGALSPCEVTFALESLSEDETLAPYFFVEDGDPAVDPFPLESTAVDVAIVGVIAEVTLTQVYKNDGTRPINARYVFLASTRAAVNGLRMTLRDQVIEAQIQERKQAQQTFEAAQREVKTASLLEQQRPNVFTMHVANILPGDRIEVMLRYTELLLPTEGQYAFVFPTVVGPRYSNEATGRSQTNAFAAAPYLRAGGPPPAPLAIRGTISAGLPIREVMSPTHALRGGFEDGGVYHFALEDAAAATAANRDFILDYRLTGDAIQSGLSLFEAGDEKYFLLLVEPSEQVAPETIPPRELVFIVDVSGSMSGFPLETAKGLIRKLTTVLRPADRFNLLLFSGDSRLLALKSLVATSNNVAKALAMLDSEPGGCGTELLPALERARSLTPEPGLARSFLVITGGYVVADASALEFVAHHLGEANVFSFGVGSSVNRYLIEGLARAGQGEPFVVVNEATAEETAARFARSVATPVLTDVRVVAEDFDAYAFEPRSIPDLLAGRPLVVVGRWRGERRGELVVTGTSGRGAFERRFAIAKATPRLDNRALPLLWARTRIAALGHYGLATPNEKARGEILGPGLRYGLLTPYTSFVAVSRLVRNTREPATDVQQPLPLPAGVSDSAVSVGAEPELVALVALLGAAVTARAVIRARRETRDVVERAA